MRRPVTVPVGVDKLHGCYIGSGRGGGGSSCGNPTCCGRGAGHGHIQVKNMMTIWPWGASALTCKDIPKSSIGSQVPRYYPKARECWGAQLHGPPTVPRFPRPGNGARDRRWDTRPGRGAGRAPLTGTQFVKVSVRGVAWDVWGCMCDAWGMIPRWSIGALITRMQPSTLRARCVWMASPAYMA
jgi:hypothetical protein